MMELNRVFLVGNLTRDPEISTVGSGTSLAKLGLAVNRRWKDRNSGEMREETAFVDIDAWGSTAEFCCKYLGKGRAVCVEGSLKYDTWQAQDGSKRSKLSVRADRIQFADPKPKDSEGGTAPQTQAAPQKQQTDGNSSDLPF